MTSDKALLSPCFVKVLDMADLVLAHDLARLVACWRHLSRAFFKPETLSEARHELLELLDDQHPVVRNHFGLGKTVVLEEVHHRAEMSTQRSTAAWSSS